MVAISLWAVGLDWSDEQLPQERVMAAEDGIA